MFLVEHSSLKIVLCLLVETASAYI